MSGLLYEKFQIMPYLNSPLFSCDSRKLLLALRTRTMEGIRNDFRGQSVDILCPLGCGELETLENILACTELKAHHINDNLARSECKYSDIFSSNVVKQRQVTVSKDQSPKMISLRLLTKWSKGKYWKFMSKKRNGRFSRIFINLRLKLKHFIVNINT